jgi:hypothetical protein
MRGLIVSTLTGLAGSIVNMDDRTEPKVLISPLRPGGCVWRLSIAAASANDANRSKVGVIGFIALLSLRKFGQIDC